MAEMKRPSEGPPSVRDTAELEAMRPDQLEAEISTHRAFAKHLEAEDPGVGKPARETAQVRGRHGSAHPLPLAVAVDAGARELHQLSQIQRHVTAAQEAQRILGPAPDSPEAQKERWEAAHSKLRRPGQAPPAGPEMSDFYRQTYEAMEGEEDGTGS